MNVLDFVLAFPKALLSYALSWVGVVILIITLVFGIYVITLPFRFVEWIVNKIKKKITKNKDDL